MKPIILEDFHKTVLETDLDLYGHVNNATYLRYFEEARWFLVRDKGFSAQEILKTQIGPIVLEANVKFFKELKCGQNITIKNIIFEHSEKIGKVRHQIFSSPETLHAEGVITFALFDLKKRKIIAPTESWKKCIGLN